MFGVQRSMFDVSPFPIELDFRPFSLLRFFGDFWGFLLLIFLTGNSEPGISPIFFTHETPFRKNVSFKHP